jgi:hypothetical protein
LTVRSASARLAQVGQFLLHRGVVARLHAERHHASREVAQLAGVAEQLRQRNVGVDLTAARSGAAFASAPFSPALADVRANVGARTPDLSEALLEPQLGQDVAWPGDLEDLVAVAEQTMSAPAAEGLALAEAARLRIADALDRLARPVVDLSQVPAAPLPGKTRFGVPASHGCLSRRGGPRALALYSVIRGRKAEISTRERRLQKSGRADCSGQGSMRTSITVR